MDERIRMAQLNTRVPKWLKEKLKKEAHASEMSLSDLIRRKLEASVEPEADDIESRLHNLAARVEYLERRIL